MKSIPLTDYGKLYRNNGAYDEACPKTLDELRSVVEAAKAGGAAIRIRASGHSLSGATLPHDGELLVRLGKLNHFRFEKEGEITVGAGALLWDVRDFLLPYGYALPVYNGGWGGPTVGGFVNAGGMGLRRNLAFVPPGVSPDHLYSPEGGSTEETALKGRIDAVVREHAAMPDAQSLSEIHGGFWENVLSLTVVDGAGNVRTIDRDHQDFPWFFASFGQLGVVVEARLKILPEDESNPPAYPAGEEGRIPCQQPEDPALCDKTPPLSGMSHLYWFSYLVSPDREELAWDELGSWVGRHRSSLKPVGGWVGPSVDGAPIGYRYTVTFKDFHPPLLYPRPEDFLLMGVMTVLPVGRPDFDIEIFEIEKDFSEIALRNGFSLYPQAENAGRTLDFAAYYSPETYSGFEQLKRKYDPAGLINPGLFFDRGTREPAKAYEGRIMAALLGVPEDAS